MKRRGKREDARTIATREAPLRTPRSTEEEARLARLTKNTTPTDSALRTPLQTTCLYHFTAETILTNAVLTVLLIASLSAESILPGRFLSVLAAPAVVQLIGLT